jgi:hypothetical protein
MTSIDFTKWLAIGTGIGIEIGSEDLTVTVVRLRPNGARVLGELTIPRFREQPAADWGAAYAGFLQKLGVGHLAATILLPRDQVTVRQISLPGVTDKDLASAVRFEIDALNPHSDEEVAYDWGRVGHTSSVLIGIALRSVVERYTALFSQAGVKAACFTFSAPTIYSALRLLSTPPKDGLLAMEPAENGLEVYGESATHPIFSARLDQPSDRVRTLAVSELRFAVRPASAACGEARNLRGIPRLSLLCSGSIRRRPAASAQLEFAAAGAAAVRIAAALYSYGAVGVHRAAAFGSGARLPQLYGSPLPRSGAGADPGFGSDGEKGSGGGA